MRILHAISNLSPLAGGPTRAGLGMARAIARRGHDVAIYTTNYDGASVLDGRAGFDFAVSRGVHFWQIQMKHRELVRERGPAKK